MVTRILLSLLLSASCFGQAFTFDDPAWIGKVATPETAVSLPDYTDGLVRHYRAQSITGKSDQDSMASWTDLTGNANFAQGTADKQPLYEASYAGFGNKPAVKFDGSNDELTQANLTDTTRTVFFVVARTGTAAAGLTMFQDEQSQVYSTTDNAWRYYFPDTAFTGAQTPQSAGILVIRHNSTASCDIRGNSGAWVNFDPYDLYSEVGTWRIGNSTAYMPCYIAEIRVYDSPLEDTNINTVGAKLASENGFSWTALP